VGNDEDLSSVELDSRQVGDRWDKWLQSLNEDDRRRADHIISSLRMLGDPSPEIAAYSEITEDIPQLARLLLLHRIWVEAINPFRDDGSWIRQRIAQAGSDSVSFLADTAEALRRMLGSGVSPDDIRCVAHGVAFETVFRVVEVIDELYSPESATAGWAIMELDATGKLTGRPIAALHEDVLTSDPSSRRKGPTA
jgi:hypothetical protein